MSKRYSAIVVGAGGIADAWFPPLLEENVEIRAVVDLDRSAAEKRVEKYSLSAPAFTSIENALTQITADFVVDLTTPEAHCSVTVAALQAGCHVIGEKPMAASMAEARKMARESERSQRTYMVSQSRRWNPVYDQLRLASQSGGIGRITTLNCDFYIGAHFGGFRDEMEHVLLLDMAIHHFDLARFISGADPVSVTAFEFNPSGSWYRGAASAMCVFEMTSSIVFNYRGSWCSEGFHTSWNGDWRVIGERGTLLCANDETPRGEVTDADTGFHRPLKQFNISPSSLAKGGMHGALDEFLRWLRGGPLPQTECHDNIKSLAMVFAAIESAQSGRPVRVADLLED